MNDACAVVTQFERFCVVDFWDCDRLGVTLGVGVHHAWDVFPNGHARGTHRHSKKGSAVIGAFPPQRARAAVGVSPDEALGDHHVGLVHAGAQ